MQGVESDYELHRVVQLGDWQAVKDLLEAHYERRSKGSFLSFFLSVILFLLSLNPG